MWYQATDISGNALRFRLVRNETAEGQSDERQYEDAMTYLTSLKESLERCIACADDEELRERDSLIVYGEVAVEAIEEDESSEKEEDAHNGDGDEDEALEDTWTPLILAITLQRWDVVKSILHFHSAFAMPTLLLLCGVTPVLYEPSSRSMVLLPGEETDSQTQLLFLLKPLVDYVAYQVEKEETIPSGLAEALAWFKDNSTARLPIHVEAVLVSLYASTQDHLLKIVADIFHYTLIPVAYVEEVAVTEKHPYYALPYACQDSQKLYILALWLNQQRKFPTSPVTTCCKEVLPPLVAASDPTDRISGVLIDELRLLQALLSEAVTAEEWHSLLKLSTALYDTKGVRQPLGATLLFPATLRLCEVIVSPNPQRASLERLMAKIKGVVDYMPLSEPVRQYLITTPSTHTECFAQLWLGANNYSPFHKFQSRLEQFYFGVLELVLVAVEANAEKIGTTPPELLDQWLQLWSDSFQSLYQRSSATIGRPTGMTMREIVEKRIEEEGEVPPELAASDDMTGALMNHSILDTMRENLSDRLRDGKGPLPALYFKFYATTSPTSSTEESLDERFERAQRGFARRAENAKDTVKLQFYGLFKQATVGDVNISKPWMVDRVGRAKWFAWEAHKGMSKEEAKQQYVELYAAFRA